jgi:GT2 family glycosyltransferase
MASSEKGTRSASIIIPSHNRRADLMVCIESVWPQAVDFDAEVIVVDDASTDGTVDILRERFPGVQVLVNAENQGPAYSRNAAAHTACGRLLCFLDSDGAVAPGWLAALLAHDDGHTVLLGCVIDFEGGRVQGVPRRATFLGKSLRCAPHRANTGPSCNLALPQAAFASVGGFDEEIPYYFEDSDLCIRARRAGLRFCYVAEAQFRHKGSERKRGEAIRHQEHNSVYAMLKCYHGQPLRRAAFTVINGLWLALRVLAWSLRGRFADARRLAAGWWSANARYARWRRGKGHHGATQ